MVILAPLGWLYGRAIDLRNSLYDRGILKSHDLGLRTISVGNLTTGGTGKTPLAAHIAEILAENGEKVCILTRGYGRRNENERVLVSDGKSVLVDAKNGGDEPVELARKLLGKAIVVADADRLGAAKWAKENLHITTFILDDAFQHRRVKRDLDIVCIDLTDPFGNGNLLPAGNLRESLRGLGRADAILLTRSEQAVNIDALRKKIHEIDANALIFSARTRVVMTRHLENFHAGSKRSTDDSPSAAFAFCGIGNPESFFFSLQEAGIAPLGTRSLTDHVWYQQTTIDEIEAEAKMTGAESLVTTAKDAVKLDDLKFTLPCFVAEIETAIDDADEFRRLILTSS